MNDQDVPELSDLMLVSLAEETSSCFFPFEKKEISLEGFFLYIPLFLRRVFFEENLIHPPPSSQPRVNSHGATMMEEWEASPVSTLGFIVSYVGVVFVLINSCRAIKRN